MQNRKFPYLIIGNGRLAKHFKYYFELLDVEYVHWYRTLNFSVDELISKSIKTLLLINDAQIIPFINQHYNTNTTWIHCSGILSTAIAECAHPLMTFSHNLYDLDTYKKVPFITDKGRIPFNQLFPELQNPHFEIDGNKRQLYHTWTSMSGNFTSILLKKYYDVLENEIGLPASISHLYLENILRNSFDNSNHVTGPITRGDIETIEKHLNTLNDDAFKNVYEAFLETQDIQYKDWKKR
ncbi:MAG: DUF2520 domain-containing protein [Melioribacteraceae bacterium]|nr:DUF2520 domain-containing protein [Melioribacteraceae bacterium]MCF8353708.1 DUF2520 domain-containing protein [Melioribacteraceae bacterium]MCF8394961.1 DUF2520 domain-containing protein [Melioribacteraceae bacterium]MCF8418624.1 DUF2520 domain-containing protein [Melioribacteraceae bacterium]